MVKLVIPPRERFLYESLASPHSVKFIHGRLNRIPKIRIVLVLRWDVAVSIRLLEIRGLEVQA